MSVTRTFQDLDLADWVSTAEGLRAEGYRLVQMTGTARDDHFEIMISFDKNYQCVSYCTQVPRDPAELPSLSGIFPAAFTYENELKDLFGIRVPGLTVDYGGAFLRTKTKIPFSGSVGTKKATPAAKPAAAASVATGSGGVTVAAPLMPPPTSPTQD